MKQYVVNGRALNVVSGISLSYWYNDRLYTVTELLTAQSSGVFDSAMRLFFDEEAQRLLVKRFLTDVCAKDIDLKHDAALILDSFDDTILVADKCEYLKPLARELSVSSYPYITIESILYRRVQQCRKIAIEIAKDLPIEMR